MKALKELFKYLFAPKDPEVSWFVTIMCRYNGHPAGPIWYNPSGDEPDYTCRCCGDDLS
jgi:hypothetical protein